MKGDFKNMTEIAASNLLTYSQITIPAGSVPKASGSFTSILRDSVRKSDLSANASSQANAQPRIGSLDEAGSLSETELEDKYCSMCGSRIKEDGSCPICIVPIFISGNPGASNSGASQLGKAVSGNRLTAAYRHRKS